MVEDKEGLPAQHNASFKTNRPERNGGLIKVQLTYSWTWHRNDRCFEGLDSWRTSYKIELFVRIEV